MNRLQMAEQMRRVLQMFAQTLTDDEAMDVATVYPVYVVGKFYRTGEMFTYGESSVGDPQLYRVVQDHTSQADWLPNNTPSLYTPIGLNDKGYPVWSKPTGAHDAYGVGDVVEFEGTLYESLISGNIYSPNEYPAGWKVYSK